MTHDGFDVHTDLSCFFVNVLCEQGAIMPMPEVKIKTASGAG
jgi:hypothetical protein